jgi:esterase
MKLFRHEYGAGKPLVILHGLFGISDNWALVGKALAHRFRVVIPDLRNHGRSPHSDVFGYPAMMDDLLEMFVDMQIESPVMLGHSMGGKLAMHLAAEYPEMLHKLVVVDISPGTVLARQAHFAILRAMRMIDFDNLRSRKEVETALARHIPEQAIRLFILKNLVRISPDRFAWRLHLEAIEKQIDGVMEGIPESVVLPHPALFIRGGNSDYITGSDLPVIAKIFPNHRLVTIPEAGHWVHADQYERFMEILNEV